MSDKIEQLIVDNMKLVPYVLIKKYGIKHYYHNFEELYQVGCVGLVRAANKYKEGLSKFSTYAIACIQMELAHHFRDSDTPLKSTRRVKYIHGRLISLADDMEQISDIEWLQYASDKLNFPLSEVLEASEYDRIAYQPLPIHDCIKGGDVTLAEIVGDNKRFESDVENCMLVDKIRELVTEREFDILYRICVDDMSQSEVAVMYSTTQASISRQKRKAILKLREEMGGYIL